MGSVGEARSSPPSEPGNQTARVPSSVSHGSLAGRNFWGDVGDLSIGILDYNVVLRGAESSPDLTHTFMDSRQPTTDAAPSLFEAGFELFRHLIASRPELVAEFESSREVFPGVPTGVDLEDKLRDRRHFEFFLFERQSESFDALPMDVLLDQWQEAASEKLQGSRATFTESITGIFVVQELEDGFLGVQELAGLTQLRIAPGPTMVDFQVGDLIVGRLYPVEGGLYVASPAAGLFRNPALRQAIEMDLSALRQSRSHAIMRLSQMELERMFWAEMSAEMAVAQADGATSAADRDPVGELETFLAREGIGREVVRSWCRALAGTPYDAKALVSGVDDLVGGMLEQLAFQTEIDLARARELLLAAWQRLNLTAGEAKADVAVEATDPDHVAQSLAEFDRDRAAGIDVETSFRELAKRLGLDDEDLDDDSEAPDFPGVVGAMVEEFLWETEESQGSKERQAHEGLRVFGAYTANIGVFENLSRREVLSFAAFWLPESRRLKSGSEAARLVRALASFSEWADQTHGLELLSGDLAQILDGLSVSLPRAVVANALLPKQPESTGELFEFLGTEQGLVKIRDGHGEAREVELDRRLPSLLEEGDLFRGHTRDDGQFVVSCCYPPEAEQLRQSLA